MGSDLEKAINMDFGGLEAFKAEFAKAAVARFGSGWVWLSVGIASQHLTISSTANQDNPLMEGHLIPILGLDVWEHAYYLKYQNRRPDYVAAFWNVVNWKKVSRNFEEYASKGLAVPPTT